MVFSSIIFLFFFLPVFLFLYYLADRKYKNMVIMAGSIFFYAWGAPRFIFVVRGTTAIDLYVVKAMDHATSERARPALLLRSLSMSLLFYFNNLLFRPLATPAAQ